MAAKFFIVAFVVILSIQALVEAHKPATGDSIGTKLEKLINKLSNPETRECIKNESDNIKALSTKALDGAQACATNSPDLKSAIDKLRNLYADASSHINTIKAAIEACTDKTCVEKVVKDNKDKLVQLIKEGKDVIKEGKKNIKPEDKQCLKNVREAAGKTGRDIIESVKTCAKKNTTA